MHSCEINELFEEIIINSKRNLEENLDLKFFKNLKDKIERIEDKSLKNKLEKNSKKLMEFLKDEKIKLLVNEAVKKDLKEKIEEHFKDLKKNFVIIENKDLKEELDRFYKHLMFYLNLDIKRVIKVDDKKQFEEKIVKHFNEFKTKLGEIKDTEIQNDFNKSLKDVDKNKLVNEGYKRQLFAEIKKHYEELEKILGIHDINKIKKHIKNIEKKVDYLNKFEKQYYTKDKIKDLLIQNSTKPLKSWYTSDFLNKLATDLIEDYILNKKRKLYETTKDELLIEKIIIFPEKGNEFLDEIQTAIESKTEQEKTEFKEKAIKLLKDHELKNKQQ
jgi:hypothetical protein